MISEQLTLDAIVCRSGTLLATNLEDDVVMMDVPNEVGSLAGIAEKLAGAGINIEYAYCTSSTAHSAGAIILRTNDLEATINALS